MQVQKVMERTFADMPSWRVSGLSCLNRLQLELDTANYKFLETIPANIMSIPICLGGHANLKRP